MKLIKPSFEIWEQEPGLEEIYKQIERAGRICYKSENKITDTSAKPFVDRMVNAGHCYTGDSEVLTIDGWKKWKDYSGEEVAVVNSDGTFKGFEVPKRIINKEYSGNFYNYNTLGIKVTDGHRMFGMFANSSEDRYKDFEGELFVCNTPYQDANKRHKTLGERWFKTQCVCNYSNIILNPYYQLIGFWLGDGCRDNSKDVLKFHLKKDRKVKYLTEICLNLGYEFSYNSYHFNIKCDGIGEYFNSTFVLNQEKYIDLKFTEDLNEIYSIIDGLLNSDGSFQKTGISFSSTSEYLMNYIYSKGPLVGFNVSVGKWKKEFTENHKQVERLFILKSNNKIVNDSRKPDSKVIITNETLPVYCVTVSTGLILVRGTNGTISICGNCAMLEHGTVYLAIPYDYVDVSCRLEVPIVSDVVEKYKRNPYTKWWLRDDIFSRLAFITTNYRVLVENDWLDDLKYLCEPTEFHERRVSVRFVCDRGVSHEFVRHRVFSFAQESTRYCNYSKDKFGNEVTYIMPCWSPYKGGKYEIVETEDGWGNYNGDIIERNGETVPENDPDYKKFLYYFINSLNEAEIAYFHLLNQGWKPQQARAVLPNALKTELVMTGFVSDWKHFFELRCAPSAHPQAQELAIPLREEFIKRGYING